MTTTAELPPAVVLGGEANALSIARRLGSMGVRVFGLGVDPFVEHSRYLSPLDLAASEGDRADAWAEHLLGPDAEFLRGAVVLAASDVGITALARHRERLLERYLLDVSEPPAQLAMLDKLETYRIAAAAGVPTPRFWEVNGPEDLERLRDELVFPLIVKPVHSHAYQAAFPGLSKFRTVANHAELDLHHRQLAAADIAVLLVERIPGPDDLLCSYYTYIDRTGSPTFDFTKRIIRRHPPGMGIATYHVTDWNPAVREVALTLFKSAGLLGVANAEFKLDRRDGQLKLIECNARFTAANCLLAAAGIDLARHVYHQVIGRPYPLPERYRTGLRLLYPTNDVRAFRMLHAAGELGTAAWLRSLAHRQTFPFMDVRDPLPALARGARRGRRAVAAIRGRR